METGKKKRSKVPVIAMSANGRNLVFDSLCAAAEYFRERNLNITPIGIQRKIDEGAPAIFKEKYYGADGKVERTETYEWFFDELFE